MTERIDAHHHLWRYSAEEYGWIDDSMAILRRDFLPIQLERETLGANIDGAVTVQARQSPEETDWLLSIAANSQLIRGVVGWANIADPGFAAELESLRERSKLKGLRHVIQAESDDDFILGADFNRGIALLRDSGLVYDILIYEQQLPQAIQFVDRHPDQIFVLDHIAKPRIAEQMMEPWRKNISELAKRKNVYCKVSGMVTEASWTAWTTESLKPYWDAVLDAFGPRRMMAGSDWPVCLVASTYGGWFEALKNWTESFSADEKDGFFGGNAIEVYKLS
jgi:L-fuconolactonase